MEDKIILFENKTDDMSFYSLKRTHAGKEYTFVYCVGNFHVYMSYHEIGERFGKSIQRKMKKFLPKYNCHYVNPNNVLRFASHEDIKNFFDEFYLPLVIEKKLMQKF